MKKPLSILIILSILQMVLSSITTTSAEDINARRYQQAQMLMEIGDYLTAAQVFQSLGDYNDSMEMYKKANELADSTKDTSSHQVIQNFDEKEAKPAIRSARIRTLGEIAVEQNILNSAWNNSEYYFRNMFTYVSEIMGDADYTLPT